ncbi:cell envelope integrity EipB family protein [Ancylobacter sp. 6x-1]|uniref:Cell envelope integrity EipB family protein n=1 Tax=Ancylobacter crimeensis TaxID=2579147 RepID=A0ABT0DCG7_9HYPH|nr:cell envelope integrity EipB family protein [Ancylobacter crimeensis]MCK0197589.1 cell envelope integrity EipB family protein [Ancylobacter crimeensis]
MTAASRLLRHAHLSLAGGLLLASPITAQAADLIPHRAVYALSLDGSKAAKRVTDADGEIVYEIRGSACAGYSVKLRQRTDLDTDGDGDMSNDLTTTTWEDAQANTYRFRITNSVGDDKSDDTDGVAERKGNTLAVKLSKPDVASFNAGSDIVLPTQHIAKMLAAAQQGDATLEARVFDGSPDGRKVYDTLSIIGKGTRDQNGVEAPLAGLAAHARYPVTVSYFEHGGKTDTPDYIISFDLYDNGVSRALKLDYGDFVLRGTLTAYEELPAEPCPK